MPSEYATRLAEIAALVAPTLREAGFRKRRNGFNRAAGESLTHVVSFQGGSMSLEGRFIVNTGIHSRQMLLEGEAQPWVYEYDCQLRKRFGERWWPVLESASAAAAHDAIRHHALPWLDRFPTEEALLGEYRATGPDDLGMAPRGPLHVAALLLRRGDEAAARGVLREYWERSLNPSHRPYVVDVAARLGLADVVGAGR